MLCSVTYLFFFFCEWPRSNLSITQKKTKKKRVSELMITTMVTSIFVFRVDQHVRERTCGTIKHIKFNIIYNDVRPPGCGAAAAAAAAQPN